MELNLDEIKDLLDAFEERNMHKLKLKKADFEIMLERSSAGTVIHASPIIDHAPKLAAATESTGGAPVAEATAADENATFIKSPMVGTFYASPSPNDPPFVKVGDKVNQGDVVCIIEAMKVMNEVKTDESGVVAEVLVNDGQPVEFGAKIFKLK